jgi:hypothetical protein
MSFAARRMTIRSAAGVGDVSSRPKRTSGLPFGASV